MKYAWIANHKAVWPVTISCDVLGMSTSGYYDHQRRQARRAGWRRALPWSAAVEPGRKGAKARFYHAVKDAKLAHLIKVDLQAEAFSFTIDEDKQRYLELQSGKLLRVTNTDASAAEVVQRYETLADIEPISSGDFGC